VEGGDAIEDTMNDMAVVFLEDSLIRVFTKEEKDYFRRNSSQFPSAPYFYAYDEIEKRRRGKGHVGIDW
jgi:hypothetical protein